MISLPEEIEKVKSEGYNEANAEARVCQDIILSGIANSSLRRNVTIKGGVVMRNQVNSEKLKQCMQRYIYEDETLPVNTPRDIINRMTLVLTDKRFL